MLQKIMNPDRVKQRIQHSEGKSAEEIRAEADTIRAETERMKEVLRKMEKENEVYSRNKWRLEPGKVTQVSAMGSQEKKCVLM